jgi:hypothetical protein
MREHTKCVVLQQFHFARLHSLRLHALRIAQSALCKKRCSTPAHNINFAVATKEAINVAPKSPDLQKCIARSLQRVVKHHCVCAAGALLVMQKLHIAPLANTPRSERELYIFVNIYVYRGRVA